MRFSDTDAMGVAHHSNYFRWLEEARIGLLRERGLPYAEIERGGVHIPLRECSCRFLVPARSEDDLQIRLWVADLSRVRIGFEYEVRLVRTGELAATARTEHVFIRDDGRPARLPAESTLWRWLRAQFPAEG